MAKVKLDWQRFSRIGGGAIHRCEIRARNDVDALLMEVHDRGRAVSRECSVTAYFRFDESQNIIQLNNVIPLYDDEGFRSPDDAKAALSEWYANNAPTLLITLAGSGA